MGGLPCGFDHGGVAFDYRPVDREQAFLVPPSLRDRLPEDHLAWFVLDVVDQLDTSALHRRHPNAGVGRAAYDPDMLLGLVIYGYAHGVRSSRRLERMCTVDVAFRVLCGQDAPDHSTLSRFVQRHADAVCGLFEQVLGMCAKARMVEVGVVAVDGTKVAANASMAASRTRDWLAAEAKRIVEEAIATDAAEDAEYGDTRGDELPAPFADPKGRKNGFGRRCGNWTRSPTHPKPRRGRSLGANRRGRALRWSTLAAVLRVGLRPKQTRSPKHKRCSTGCVVISSELSMTSSCGPLRRRPRAGR